MFKRKYYKIKIFNLYQIKFRLYLFKENYIDNEI